MRRDIRRRLLQSFPALAAVLLITGCVAPLPPTPRDLESKRFEQVPGKAVIYVARGRPDFTREPTGVMLDDNMKGTSYPGTYFRWVVMPGRHRIAGFASDGGVLMLNAEADRIHFIQHSVTAMFGRVQSTFQPVPEHHGRQLVMRGELTGSP
jgi:hypothetical protein